MNDSQKKSLVYIVEDSIASTATSIELFEVIMTTLAGFSCFLTNCSTSKPLISGKQTSWTMTSGIISFIPTKAE